MYPNSHTDYFKVRATNPSGYQTSREKRYQTIQNITKLLVATLEFEVISQRVVDIMVEQMDYLGGILFIPDKNTQKLIPWTTSDSPVVNQILKILPKKLREYNQSYEDVSTNNLVAKTFIEKKVYQSSYYPEFISPAVPESQAKLIQKLTGTKESISYPIIYKDTVLGVALFVSNKETLSEEEKEMLQTFTELVGVTLNTAKLFEEINNQIFQLTKKNEDLSSLYNLTANVSRSLDPFKVAQAAVNSIPQDKMLVGSVLTRYYPDKNYVAPLVTSENQLSYAVRKLIGDFTQYGLKLDDPEAQVNLVVRVVKTETPMFTNNISEFFVPALGSQFLDPIAKIINIKCVATYPLIIRGRTIGALSFMIKEKNAEEIDANEKQLLQTYTNQIAIALENANLFAQSQEIQAKLEKTLKELEAARKHERDMIDIMGHELRTPMSIVRNALIMMDTQIKANPADLMDKIKRYVDIGVESARREVSLIETLLSATKTDGKGFQLLLEKVDLNDIINNSLIAFKREAERKGLTLTFEPPQTPVLVYADKTRIQEIADNFINNAIKYTMRGNINIKVWDQEGYGYVSVKDSGIGISEEDLKKLGQKFFRARQYIDDVDPNTLSPEKLEVVRPGGTGLGLFVTFNLIKIMDGKLDVQSKVKEGSTFTFAMPIFSGQQTKQIERKVEPSE